MPRAIPLSDIDLSKCGPDSPLHKLAKRASRARPRQLEHIAQVMLFEKIAELPPDDLMHLAYAIPNFFGVGTKATGGRAKAEGRRPGMPDVCEPVKVGPYGAGYFELKISGNTLSTEQKKKVRELRDAGNFVDVVRVKSDDPAELAALAFERMRRYLDGRC